MTPAPEGQGTGGVQGAFGIVGTSSSELRSHTYTPAPNARTQDPGHGPQTPCHHWRVTRSRATGRMPAPSWDELCQGWVAVRDPGLQGPHATIMFEAAHRTRRGPIAWTGQRSGPEANATRQSTPAPHPTIRHTVVQEYGNLPSATPLPASATGGSRASSTRPPAERLRARGTGDGWESVAVANSWMGGRRCRMGDRDTVVGPWE